MAQNRCIHCVKSGRIQSFSGPYFPAFGRNTDQNNSEYGHFLRSDCCYHGMYLVNAYPTPKQLLNLKICKR